MKPRVIYNAKLIVLFVLLFVLLQSCATNLPAVREFSKVTVAASSSFENIADDLPKSCIRAVEIGLKDNKIKISIEEKEDGKVDYSNSYKERLKTCDDLRDSLYGIIAANNVLRNYAEALGKLASDDVVTFAGELNSLQNSLKKGKISNKLPFNDQQIAAIFNLTNILSRIAADGYRQKELGKTITMGEPHLKKLTEGLIFVVEEYKLILDDEKIDIKLYQNELLRASRKIESGEADSPLQKELVEYMLIQTKKLIDSINNKKKASDDYIIVLKKISTTHTALNDGVDELDSAILLGFIQRYAEELIPAINKLRIAFQS